MKVELSKRLRSVVLDLAAKAYEREMRGLLTRLADDFANWRAGNTDTSALLLELDNFGHRRRRLTQQYESRSCLAPMNVAYAVVVGILSEKEVPTEVREALAKPLAFYRQRFADGTLSMQEED